MKKLLIWLSIIIVIAGSVAGWFFYQRRQNENASTAEILRSTEISRGDLVITVPASGSIASHRSNELHFPIFGQVQDVLVQVGDQVKEGQVLATINTRDLRQALDTAQIVLDQAELNLRSLHIQADESDIALAELSIHYAQQTLVVAKLNKDLAASQAALSNRMAREIRDDVRQAYLEFQKTLEKYNLPYIYGAGINAANMEAEGNVGITALKGNFSIQQAESSWWAAYSGLENAQQSLTDLVSAVDPDRIKQAELQIKQAQLNVDLAQQRLNTSAIIAPYDGTISAVNIIEDLPTPTQGPGRNPAIVILDNETLYANVSIDEIDIGKIKLSQTVDILLDAYPDVMLQGEVVSIQEVPSNLGGIISYSVRISLENLRETLPRDGMTASVFIETRTVENILLIPNWAIRTDQTTSDTFVYCYCLVDGTPQRTSIETGLRNDMFTQVTMGLDEGSTVVLIAEERSLFDFQGRPSFGD